MSTRRDRKAAAKRRAAQDAARAVTPTDWKVGSCGLPVHERMLATHVVAGTTPSGVVTYRAKGHIEDRPKSGGRIDRLIEAHRMGRCGCNGEEHPRKTVCKAVKSHCESDATWKTIAA